MLQQPLFDKLSSLKLAGMLEGLREQMESAYSGRIRPVIPVQNGH